MATLPIRIYYEDTDAGGVVYHANHIKYFERGRTEWLRELGWEQDKLLADDLVFVVKSLNINYRRPAVFNQLLALTTSVSKIKRASIVFEQQLYDADQQLIADGQVTVASVKHSTMKPTAIPTQLTEDLASAR